VLESQPRLALSRVLERAVLESEPRLALERAVLESEPRLALERVLEQVDQ
jgi:hypothetical protein